MPNQFDPLSTRDLRQIIHTLLREWASDISESPRGTFIDFHTKSPMPLGLYQEQRFRLFTNAVTKEDVARLQEEAAALNLTPIIVTPRGLLSDVTIPPGVTAILPEDFGRLCHESGMLCRDENNNIGVDRIALRALKDLGDAKLALVNGLLWLRTLSRDRVPPPLQWTGVPAHELFERCFYLVMTTTFRCGGISWGTRNRGRPYPDGVLFLPSTGAPALYDCKASYEGYEMSYRDLTGFVDYLRDPLDTSVPYEHDGTSRFLIVSSEIHGGTREASFARRQEKLAKKVPGAKLTWVRAKDIVRFGCAIERVGVTPKHREAIKWGEILDVGDVQWDPFQAELDHLAREGYMFEGRA